MLGDHPACARHGRPLRERAAPEGYLNREVCDGLARNGSDVSERIGRRAPRARAGLPPGPTESLSGWGAASCETRLHRAQGQQALEHEQ